MDCAGDSKDLRFELRQIINGTLHDFCPLSFFLRKYFDLGKTLNRDDEAILRKSKQFIDGTLHDLLSFDLFLQKHFDLVMTLRNMTFSTLDRNERREKEEIAKYGIKSSAKVTKLITQNHF